MTHRPVPQRPQPRSLILITALITLGVLAGAEEKDPTTSLLSLFQNLDDAPLAEVRRLVYAGAEVDAVTTSGYRLVNEAAATGRADVVELLANAGADVNASHPATGLVPLLLAAFGGHAETVRVLLDAGADVSITANNDVSVLDAAAVGGDTAVVALLLNAGADVNAAAANGVTPLFVAASEGHPQIARQLLDAGADVNAVGDMDQTPLHVAVMQRDVAMARLLLENGARDDLISEFGATARQEAKLQGGQLWDVFQRTNRT